jgi:putative holliday junction resolvase
MSLNSQENQRIIALDVGSKTCGVAMTDPMAIICQPVTTITYKGIGDQKRAFEALRALFVETEPKTIVVGQPSKTDGSDSKQAKKIQLFIVGLKKYLKAHHVKPDLFEWVYCDESFTSTQAHALLKELSVKHAKRKKVIDKMAAVIILQNYLDSF